MTEYYGAPRSGASLTHHGIKGQKWGVRRFQNKDGSLTRAGKKRYSSGDLILEENEKSLVAKAVAKISSQAAQELERDVGFTIKDKSGNKVGRLYLYKKSPEELNINWIDIKKEHRGHGYAQKVLTTVEKEAAKSGYKKITLEVPDDDPSALHIYEKMGFKKSGERIDDILTPMELYLKHSEMSENANMQYSNELYRHGIKGQKWGVRRFQNHDGTLTSSGRKRKARVEKRELKRDRAEVKKALYSTYNAREYALRKQKKERKLKAKIEEAQLQGKTARAEKLTNKHNRLVEKVDSRVNPIMEKNVKTLRDVTVRRGKEQADKWLRESAVNLSCDDIYMNGFYARIFNNKRYEKYNETSKQLSRWRDAGG